MPLEPLTVYCVLGKMDIEFQRGRANVHHKVEHLIGAT
jgi:hypothetical protein